MYLGNDIEETTLTRFNEIFERNRVMQNDFLFDYINFSLIITVLIQSLRWKNVHRIILNICIAMWQLQLPNYVLLEIIDWLPYYEAAVSHFKKIRLIENVNRSITRIKGNKI
jgi:hypothetical protein